MQENLKLHKICPNMYSHIYEMAARINHERVKIYVHEKGKFDFPP